MNARLGSLALLLGCGVALGAPDADAARRLQVSEGSQSNAILQTRRQTSHTLVREGSRPRVLVATPAGSSGIGLWFKPLTQGTPGLRRTSRPREVRAGALTGVAFDVDAPSGLELDRLELDSVRALRFPIDGEPDARAARLRGALTTIGAAGRGDPAVEAFVQDGLRALTPVRVVDPARPGVVIFERKAIGSDARYRVELVPAPGTVIEGEGQKLAIRAAGQGSPAAPARARFTVRSFIDRRPLTPLSNVLRSRGAAARKTDQRLGLLVYEEGYLAGSWQYLNRFGRDTLISAKLLGKRLSGGARRVAVESVLDSVSPDGEVAHEESIGDLAAFENLLSLAQRVERGTLRAAEVPKAKLEEPRYDYKMVDGEYLLPHLVDEHVAGGGRLSPARLDALARVAVRIGDQTAAFARAGRSRDLVALKPGEVKGNWRDSVDGLGGGRVPMDVNAILVPAGLRALARLMERPGFDRAAFAAAVAAKRPGAEVILASPTGLRARAGAWTSAAGRFAVKVPAATARQRLAAYVATLPEAERSALGRQRLWSGVTVGEALAGKAAPELDGGLDFDGVSLDAGGKPVPVMSSDGAFDLFYGEPTREQVLRTVTTAFQPFPVGLMTPVGMVVANPAFSDRAGDAAMFGRDKYHGAVVWSWPGKMMREGLRTQLGRFRGDPEVTRVLRRALQSLGRADARAASLSSSELWSWEAKAGKIAGVPFGASETHANEGNALQLWSTL